MSVLITNDVTTLNESINAFRIVSFNRQSKYGSVNKMLDGLRTTHAMRLRKGTLRVNNTSFTDTALYPPKFNNYNIVLRAADGKNILPLHNTLRDIIVGLRSINKTATITIKDWNNMVEGSYRATRPSQIQAIINEFNLTATNQVNENGIVVVKTIKV